MPRLGTVIAARTSSTRLPGKALLPLAGLPMVTFLLRRLAGARADVRVLATTTLPSDDRLAETVAHDGVAVFRGHPTDLIDRYAAVAETHRLDVLVRITADCPFVDAGFLDHCLAACAAWDWDFDLATTKGAGFPVGIDAEIFTAAALRRMRARPDLSEAHREHLTLAMYDHPEDFRIRRIAPPAGYACDQSFTVDTAADYDRAVALVARLGGGTGFSVPELLRAA